MSRVNMDIHNYKRQLERQIELVQESKEISCENKKVIVEFKDYLLSEGIGAAKITRYLSDCKKFALMVKKSFCKANELDLRKIIAEIEQTNLAAESKKSFKIFLRKLYRFIRGFKDKGKYPPEVDWISIAIPKNHGKLPEELLTEDEIKQIIHHCGCSRDRALITAIAETGARVSEIGTMNIKHVSFEEYGARLTIKGKTGTRKVLAISSAPYMQQWINEHPKNSDPNAPLWYNPRGEFLTYSGISAILKKAARRAGIKKRIYLHLLRHSRATHMASIMSESAMKQYFGWGQDSKMAAIYVHMSGKDTDEAILRANGIEVEKKVKKSELKPLVCIRCKTKNESTNKFCKLCGMILDKETQEEVIRNEMTTKNMSDVMDKLLHDPEILTLIRRKLENVTPKAI